ncbi:MAG TPA: phosphotyrosine protein phosphatase [Oceanospirillales bacterium]|nr:phosphotyrosine protein phosphatase [Oceanospirillaceae bacterium]HBS43213.1 phosphotyrosine protein phosphatase [Oceanospirillales bacterium]|tara:strand:- start:1591 stop:2064 length:474 start_codon:yes stop_codon:yes gene_type:complete
MIRVLFVCLGNICRSPTAHGVMLSRLKEEGLEEHVEVDSAGTASWHIGRSPDPRSQHAARQRGVDISDLKARQVCEADFHQFDYLLAMDSSNLKDLKAMHRVCGGTVPQLFVREFAHSFTEQEVPDPYYGGEAGFRHVLDLVEDACDGLIADIRSRL